MSASVDEIPNVVNGIDGDDDDDEEEDDDDAEIENLQRRRRGFGRAKEVVLHPFTKVKNKIRRIRSRRALLRSSSSSGNASSSGGSSGKVIVRGDGNRNENGTVNGNGIGNCKFCFSCPKVLESSDDSSPTTSDPNDPKFTHAMLRALIENNDFYSKECNPHVD